MKPVHQWTAEDVLNLVGTEEDLRTEFKSGRLFDDDAKVADELSKQVSAFANSEGGLLVLGMSESKTSKKGTAVAERPDGVPRRWTGHRVQQTIESNVSPLLMGIRVRPVEVPGLGEDRWVVLVAVPQGSTAYQASDRRYYGRSEYEAKALPDHEVRLRMSRDRGPQARVLGVARRVRLWGEVHQEKLRSFIKEKEELARVVEQRGIQIPAVPSDDDPAHAAVLRRLTAAPHLVDSAQFLDRFFCDEYAVDLELENTGDRTLRNLEVALRVRCAPGFYIGGTNPQPKEGFLMPDASWDRERVEDIRIRWSSVPTWPTREAFPGARVELQRVWFLVPRGRELDDGAFSLEWTVYLDDARPCTGSVDLSVPP